MMRRQLLTLTLPPSWTAGPTVTRSTCPMKTGKRYKGRGLGGRLGGERDGEEREIWVGEISGCRRNYSLVTSLRAPPGEKRSGERKR